MTIDYISQIQAGIGEEEGHWWKKNYLTLKLQYITVLVMISSTSSSTQVALVQLSLEIFLIIEQMDTQIKEKNKYMQHHKM